jgi:hypothetical protein
VNGVVDSVVESPVFNGEVTEKNELLSVAKN